MDYDNLRNKVDEIISKYGDDKIESWLILDEKRTITK